MRKTLAETNESLRETLVAFNGSPCCVLDTTDQIAGQLHDIETAFDQFSVEIKENLENLRENESQFSITLFGRTMAGKSTLMEILTHGNGNSIGRGGQRTTKDIRHYTWRGLQITDVPGIGAVDGEEDEQIAYTAAKTADLIVFLISDDGPQALEAECLAKIVSFGKPVLCVMNLKKSISSRSSIRIVKKDIDKHFDDSRLSEIKNQFMSYAYQYGQNWDMIPFVYVHLLSAYTSQTCVDDEKAAILYEVSRFEQLEKKIIEIVQENGCFYRIKNHVDIITNPLLEMTNQLLHQSDLNEEQRKIIYSKRFRLSMERNKISSSKRRQIRSLILKIKSELNGEIAAFAEEHYKDQNADKAWNRLLSEKRIQSECQIFLRNLEKECQDQIREFSREITRELDFNTNYVNERAIRVNQFVDSKRIWNWSTNLMAGGLSIGWLVSNAMGASVAGPLGIGALAVAVVGKTGSMFFKSRDKKIHEARIRLEKSLKENVEDISNSLEKQMIKSLDAMLEASLKKIEKELDILISLLHRLSKTQNDLAWRLNENLLELNKSIVTEGLNQIGAQGLEYHVLESARIPGYLVVLEISSGTVFPEAERNLLSMIMSEPIEIVHISANKKTLISRVLGGLYEESKIFTSDDSNVVSIPSDVDPQFTNIRVNAAQQLSRLLIKQM